jgi:1-deoxy-D-xylulose-5-phosphate synthase
MVELASKDPHVVGITAAMPDGTGLDRLQQEIPGQFFDVGIAEQHGVTFAAGLATQGCRPVVAVYSTFLQRAFDQVIHDVALQNLHVVFVLDRAGLVGADGPTHHGVFDLSYLRLIPGMTIMIPKDESELRDMLYTALYHVEGPVALRYPRGNCIGVPLKEGFDRVTIGKSETLRKGGDIAILAVGSMVQQSVKAAEILEQAGISALVCNMRFLKPLDRDFLDELAGRFSTIVTVEDNVRIGGFGSAVCEHFARKEPSVRVVSLGIPDHFVEHGTQGELYRDLGLDPEGIAAAIAALPGHPMRPNANRVANVLA